MKATKSYGDPIAVVMTRPRNCALKADGTKCPKKSRMAIIVPTREPGEEAEMSCVSLCSDCFEGAFVNVVKEGMKTGKVIFPFVAWDVVDEAVIEALARITIKKEDTTKEKLLEKALRAALGAGSSRGMGGLGDEVTRLAEEAFNA